MKTIHTQEYKKIIHSLVQLRNDNNITQMELAKKLRISQSDVSKIEKCERRLDIIELYNWLKNINADVESFLVKQIREIDKKE